MPVEMASNSEFKKLKERPKNIKKKDNNISQSRFDNPKKYKAPLKSSKETDDDFSIKNSNNSESDKKFSSKNNSINNEEYGKKNNKSLREDNKQNGYRDRNQGSRDTIYSKPGRISKIDQKLKNKHSIDSNSSKQLIEKKSNEFNKQFTDYSKNSNCGNYSKRKKFSDSFSKNKESSIVIEESEKGVKKHKIEDCSKESEENVQSNTQSSESDEESNKNHKEKQNKNKEKQIIKSRSNPKYEYNLEDAKPDEKELILKGTIADRTTCLALLCARNPSNTNYKQLLLFCENQRNDVICTALSHIRDLLKEQIVEDSYIKGRIIKSFELGLKNQYIKKKVIDYVAVLARAGIYSTEFVGLLASRLLEKKEVFEQVCQALKSLFIRYESLIIENVEDFYYKNDNYKDQLHALKFLGSQTFIDKKIGFNFYEQALTTIDENYCEEFRNIMLEYIINGLSLTISEDDKIRRIDFIRKYLGRPKTVISALNLLLKINDPYTDAYIQRIVKSHCLKGTEYECNLLNILSKRNDKNLVLKLMNDCFFYSNEYILGLIMIASEMELEPSKMFGLRILILHYDPIVRHYALNLFKKCKFQIFDPYDKVMVSNLASTMQNI